MSRASMSRAALVAANARAAANTVADAAAVVAGESARAAAATHDARMASAIDSVTGHGDVPGGGAQLTPEEWDRRSLLALVETYPIGASVHFRTYDPTIRAREWRRAADSAAWGLRRNDALEVTGYGGSTGFPDGLSVRRPADGPDSPLILVFPAELLSADSSVAGSQA